MALSYGGSFGTSSSSSSSKSYLPEQAKWLTNILSQYGPQVGTGANVYQGKRVAGMTPGQQAATNVGGWEQYLQPGYMPGYGSTGQALTNILSGEMGAEPYSQSDVDTLFKTAYQRPAEYQWQKTTLPSIREAYSGPGFWSTSRMEAERQGAEDMGNWLGQQYGNLTWNTDQANKALQEARAGRALSAVPLGMEYSTLPTNQAITALQGREQMFNVASPAQQQQQNEINAAMQKFAEENQITDPEILNVMMQLLGMQYQSSKSSSRSTSGGLSI